MNALINGKGYQTAQQVETAITGKGYQTQAQVNTLINGKGYATQTALNTEVDTLNTRIDNLTLNSGSYSPIQVKGNAGSGFQVASGGTINIKGGNNISTTANGDTLTINADLTGYATEQFVTGKGYQTQAQVNALINGKGYATQTWVGQQGYLKNTDLNGYATQQWVNNRGYQTATQVEQAITGKGYQTQTQVNALINGKGYATQTWVGQQGYLKNTDLNGYATQQWVGQQGYQTQSEVNSAIDTKLRGNATQAWVTGQGYLTQTDKTELENQIKTGKVDLSDYSTTAQTQQWVKQQGYQNNQQVQTAIDSKLGDYSTTAQTQQWVEQQGYQTAAQVEQAITGKGYQTQAQVDTAINNKLQGNATQQWVTQQGYQTADQVEQAVTGKGYQTQAQVDTAINNKLQGNATQQWVNEQNFAKQKAVDDLDDKLSNLVLTSGAYSPITVQAENGDFQMESNGSVSFVGDDNINTQANSQTGEMQITLDDNIKVETVSVGGNNGVVLSSNNNQGVSLGAGNNITGNQAIGVGTGLTVSGNNSGAIGDPTVVTGDNAYSIGNNNTISTDNTYALGSNINATAANSVFLGNNAAYTAAGNSTAGLDAYDTNDSDIGGIAAGSLQFAGGTPAGVVSVGSVGGERRIQNVAAGKLSADSTDAVNGSQLYRVAEQIEQVSSGGAGVVQYADENGVANGGVASNDVTVVGANPNAPVVIHNVSAGARPTDAVNVAQLQHSMAMSEARLNNRIDRVEKRANAGTAAAMAAGNLQNAARPGGNSFSISGATFAGEAGYAMGYSTMSSDGKWGFNAFGNGDSRGRFGGGASVGFHW